MAKIIYFEDILSEKMKATKNKKTPRRTKLKPFKYASVLSSELVERKKNKNSKDLVTVE